MKHAFLIMAHNRFDQLELLVKSLNHADVGIFIHIDSSSHDFPSIDFNSFLDENQVVEIIFGKVYWGGYTQIQAEQKLFAAAATRGYDYYHLISGDSMLLVSVDTFICKVSEQYPKQLMEFNHTANEDMVQQRVRYFYPTDFIKNRKLSAVFGFKISPILNRILGIDRLEGITDITLRKGSNWVSITDSAVKCLLLERNIQISEQLFRYGFLVDELYVQTILTNADSRFEFADYVWDIDWSRGKPYTFDVDDVDELEQSNKLIARKVTTELFKNFKVK